MSEQTLPVARQFEDGEEVALYDAEGYIAFPVAGPPGAPLAEAIVAGGEVTFTELEANHSYFIAARVTVGGPWINLSFTHLSEDPESWHTIGPPGADGAAWFEGNGAPDNSLGVNGDYYIDATAGAIYGPKLGDAWPAGPLVEFGEGGGEGGGTSLEILDVGTAFTTPRPSFDHVIWVWEGATAPENLDPVKDIGINDGPIKGSEVEGVELISRKVKELSGESETEYPSEYAVQKGLATRQPLDSDLTAIAELATTSFGRELLNKASAAAVRSYIEAAKSGEGGGGISEAEAKALDTAYAQPLDSDLTAIAALTTNAVGRELLTKTTIAALRTYLELGTAALEASTAFQPKDTDLTEIAALTTTSTGRALLAMTISTITKELLEQTTAANWRSKLEAQKEDADLTSIAALTTTASGRELLTLTISTITKELLEQTTAALWRTKLGLGTIATKAEGEFQPNDSDLTSIAALTTTANGRTLLTLTTPNLEYDEKSCFIVEVKVETLFSFYLRVPSGETCKFISARAKTASGTYKFKVKRTTSGAAETEPLKEKEVTSTVADFSPSAETCADKDLWEVICETTSSGAKSPITLTFERVKT